MRAAPTLAPLALATLLGCAPDDRDRSAADAADAADSSAAAEHPSGIQEHLLVSADWLERNLESPGVVVLQVGEEGPEGEEGRIPGARLLPLSAISEERDGLPGQVPEPERLRVVFEELGVTGESRVILYGAPLPAARAFVALDVLGMGDRAALLDGGPTAWRERRAEAGLERAGEPPEASEPAAPRRETYRRRDAPPPASLRPDLVVDADWVASRRERPGVALLDARPPAEYSGEEPGGGVPRAGHIPGARNLFWQGTIESPERPLLRDPDTLRRMFEEAGASPGDTVVTYCRSGMQSSFLYFVARYLGYETRLYDGSFLDWSRRSELPVARGAGE